MPNEDGFDLLLSLPSERYSVVFVTAYNQYALRAIKANALDYILKPVDIEELKASVQKVLKIHAAKATDGETRETYQATLNHTYQTLREPEQTITKLTLPQSHGLTIVNTVDIIYLEADSNYTVFFMRDGKRLVVAKTLKEFEEILDERTFVRIHKSSILHLAYLKTFSALNSNATTTTGDVLAVSRRRWAEFTERVSAYSTRV